MMGLASAREPPGASPLPDRILPSLGRELWREGGLDSTGLLSEVTLVKYQVSSNHGLVECGAGIHLKKPPSLALEGVTV